MTTTQFTDAVEIDGSQDTTQLNVQGHSTQNAALQTWQDSNGTDLASVSGDGRLHVGDDLGASTDDALIEVHRDESSTHPARALNAFGRISGVVSNSVQWVVHELEVLGSAAITGLHSSLRVRLRQASTGDVSQADLVAADVEASNETGSLSTPVGQITGLRSTLSNASNGYIEDAVGVDIDLNNDNATSGAITNAYGIRISDVDQADTNYALHSGAGLVHLQDALELQAPATDPSTPSTGTARVYAKSDGHVYAKAPDGSEYKVSMAQTPQAGDESKVLHGDGTWQTPNDGTVTSVGVSAPTDLLTVSNSPVTDNGNIQLDKAPVNANRFYAGPASGVATDPTFRALDVQDLPADVVTNSAIADGAVSDAKVASGISGAKLQANSVTNSQIADLTVRANELANDAVTTAKIASGAVTGNELASNAVTQAKMAANSVDSDQYVDGSVDNVHLASGIDGNKILTGSMDGNRLTDGTVWNSKIVNLDGAKITDGTVTNAELASGIDASKITTGSMSGARISAGTIDTEHLSTGAATRAKTDFGGVTETPLIATSSAYRRPASYQEILNSGTVTTTSNSSLWISPLILNGDRDAASKFALSASICISGTVANDTFRFDVYAVRGGGGFGWQIFYQPRFTIIQANELIMVPICCAVDVNTFGDEIPENPYGLGQVRWRIGVVRTSGTGSVNVFLTGNRSAVACYEI